MKLFVATSETQGARADDFFWTDEGEPLMFGFECTNPETAARCGCNRSLVGLNTHRATTTFKVIDKPLTIEDFANEIRQSLEAAGFLDESDFACEVGYTEDSVMAEAWQICRAAELFAIGQVLERSGDKINPRDAISEWPDIIP